MNRKGALGFSAIVGIAVAILILVIGGGGILKFLLTDKTPYIFIGILILLFLMKKKRRER